ILFSGTLPMSHIALGGFSPLFIAFSRAVLAAMAAGLVLVILKKPWPTGKVWPLFAAGLCLIFGFPIFSSIAMQTIPASHGGVVLGILPLLTSIFSAIIDGERPGKAFWAFGILGAALVVFYAVHDHGYTPEIGDLWLFAAAVSASCGYVISGRLARNLSGWEVISWALIICLPLSLAGTLATWSTGVFVTAPSQLAALAYLGLISMFLGFVFWNAGLAMGGIARVAQVQLLQSFFTIALSALLLREEIALKTILFAAAVATIVWLGRKSKIV
ncbi:MAG: hypothetical protein RIR97_553, partial [Pseudomonadota bacterium]